MHRHGYKGRKFGRERDQREALLKGLADALVREEAINTTLPKAKELVPYVEKLITKAKRGDLHSRRQIISSLQTLDSAHKLVDEVAPKLKKRTSGHLRIAKTVTRRGDNAQMARVSFVDDLNEAPVAKAAAPKVAVSEKAKTPKETVAKVATKKAEKK
ncbi:MAG TPA: 50S ribosomal protein L17 [Candidatus Saccharibacteria bacterium]|nr:50S ribosomal protein L17 [Candidatus Saccharibacteria bacterium]